MGHRKVPGAGRPAGHPKGFWDQLEAEAGKARPKPPPPPSALARAMAFLRRLLRLGRDSGRGR